MRIVMLLDKSVELTLACPRNAVLEPHNGQPIKVTITRDFKPSKGKSSSSTSTVTLDA